MLTGWNMTHSPVHLVRVYAVQVHVMHKLDNFIGAFLLRVLRERKKIFKKNFFFDMASTLGKVSLFVYM